MKSSRFLLAAAAAALGAGLASAADPTVSDVTISQSGRQAVTITYKLSGDPGIVTLEILDNGEPISGECVTFVKGDVNKFVEPTADGEVSTITWQAEKSWPQQRFAAAAISARVTARTTNAPPDVLVVDLSDGAMRYYTDESYLPGGGLTNDLYRLSQMVFRRIPAAGVTATLGGKGKEYTWQPTSKGEREAAHKATFSKDYYIGVFEVTQGQWSKVFKLGNPSTFKNLSCNEVRPVEKVGYGNIRGTTEGGNTYWSPENGLAPSATSFIGILRTLTGAAFDLPTECQWEYAAHGGDTNTFYNGHTYIASPKGGNTVDETVTAEAEANLSLLGRWRGNGGYVDGTTAPDAATCTTEYGTARVGSYLPNAYGLYDMLGNVRETCRETCLYSTASGSVKREWSETDNVDPVSSQAYGVGTFADADYSKTGGAALIKGGAWSDAWYKCIPSAAESDIYGWEGKSHAGCRIILEIPQP